MTRVRRILYCIAAAITLSPVPGAATTTQAFERSWKICAEQTQLQERVAGIPQHLLTAISKAESGRWDDANKASIAWPWTVTSGGEGRFYDSREEALAEVRRLKAAGVKNIDVGCMQVNLMHHGHQFASVEHAMDPAANAAYAATFLKSLKDQTGDWRDAAGRYHSSTPDKHARYMAKIDRLWAETRKAPIQAPMPAFAALAPKPAAGRIQPPANPSPSIGARRAASPLGAGIAGIDHARTEELNKRFKARREQATVQRGGAAGQQVRERQLAAWRSDNDEGQSIAVLSTARRGMIDADIKRQFRANAAADKQRFDARRQRQVEKWRIGQSVNFAGDS